MTKRLVLLPVYLYRYLISPLLGPRCRFEPTCSSYAIDAIQLHGISRGSWLSLKRLGKCHPWHPGGYDPVPGQSSHSHHHH
nr:membrane protein insertion efficiency factor YidD [Teredinibacter haidensis]